jgi:hypothetical protein
MPEFVDLRSFNSPLPLHSNSNISWFFLFFFLAVSDFTHSEKANLDTFSGLRIYRALYTQNGNMGSRRDFLSMPAPENYVAGLGRGATGFTTRSDLGPAREGPSEEQMKEMLAKRAAQLGQAAPSAYGVVDKKDDDEDDDRFQDPDNEVGLFSSGMNYDKEDDEADRIYQDVDERMDKRRRARRLVSSPLPSLPLLPPCLFSSRCSSTFSRLNRYRPYPTV